MNHCTLPGALALGVALAAALAACASPSPPPPAPPVPASEGLVLPPGDPVAGRDAFLDLQCCVCHSVKGGGFPAPTIYPPLPFVLGERWTEPPDRMWLATSVVNPSHEVLPGNVVTFHGGGEVYRMKNYADTMTVAQMIDLVDFLSTLADGER